MDRLAAKAASITGGLIATLAASAAIANPFSSRDLRFDQMHWVTTHNAYEKINQNLQELPQQLKDGVRGFMLDLYYKPQYRGANAIRVCHKEAMCYGSFANQLANEFLPFLEQNRNEIVTLFLETYITHDQLQQFLDSYPQVADVAFNPNDFSGTAWPTQRQMIQSNGRLVLFADSSRVAGEYIVKGRPVHVLYDQDWLVQNRWDTLGPVATNVLAAHDFSCPTRWGNLPLSTAKVSPATGKQWNRLFLMNQFHHVTSTTFDSGSYDNNLTYLLRRANNCGRQPNFIGVNNYRNGDLDSYAKALTHGGIYLGEGNNADSKQDAVCVIPRGQRTLRLPSAGCENDEARSLSLSGIDRGTRIKLFDSASGNREDDHVIIDVKRNIGLDERIVIPSFQQTVDNSHYQMVYVRNNGLDGKISRIEVSQTPNDYSDAAIALYEGNNATQNLDCVIPFHTGYTIRMKSNRYGCSNDEIRSARILKAKAGTEFTLTGHPGGNFNQGRTVVEILRNITSPVTIPSFNRSYQNANVRVTNHKQGVDGKISFGYIGGSN
ncbi:MAG TPA: hypothetical protein VN798_04805 [Pseudomonas sp.]|nr:hypothetical protein [Pseudomonas sp.]